MKKLLSLSASKVLILCGLGLATTLGAFWHYQTNQAQIGHMNVLNQGVGTCFNRISQTFTAMMIKDMKSPYLHRAFMALSDECLSETIKGINPFRRNIGKGHETLNKLMSEVHWFHEKVLKIHTPIITGHAQASPPLAPLSDRFTKMENLKVTLMDEIDSANARFRVVLANDEVLMGLGLLLFVIGLSILSLQEFNRIQLRRELEKEAINLLKAGQSNVGALVDSLVNRALLTQNMNVTAQIFRDYHEDLLENTNARPAKVAATQAQAEVEKAPLKVQASVQLEPNIPSTSLKEVLVSLHNTHTEEIMRLSDVRDVRLAVDYEACEQIINAAVNKLAEKRTEDRKVMITNQVHTDRCVVNFFLAGPTFTAAELEFASHTESVSLDGDMNMTILLEMVKDIGAGLHIENKTDRQGKITGMSIRLVLKRVSKERSKLVSMVKGKKKDLVRELMN